MRTNRPALSVVLRVVEGVAGVERCVRRLRAQASARDVEVIVPLREAEAADLSQWCRDEVRVVVVGESAGWRMSPPAVALHARCDIGSAVGFASAAGDVVASLEDAALPSASWVRAMLDGHARFSDEAIGGPIDVEAADSTAWAAFWLDFGPYVPPLRAGERDGLSDVNVSYKRGALEAVRGVWSVSYNEFLVHRALRARGCRFRLVPDAAVVLRRPGRPIGSVLAERYHWGRIFGAVRRRTVPAWNSTAHVCGAPAIPLALTWRLARRAAVTPGHGRRLLGALPAALACSAAWCGGEVHGQVTGEPFWARVPDRRED